MSDPQKRWLADDPRFLDRLNDLDSGLVGDEVGDDVASTEPPSQVIAVAAPLPFTRSSGAAEARVRRPLLDLFPPSAFEPDRPPLPMFGTAVGPNLPASRLRQAPPSEPDAGAPSPLHALAHETFYGLREQPFSLSTDVRFLYRSAAHERAAHELLEAIRKGGGLTVVTAPNGLGKTTLCQSLIDEIDRRTVTSVVLDPPRSFDDLLKTMLVDFGVISRGDLVNAPPIAREVLTATLHSFVESLAPLQAGALVILDEAQDLAVELLAELDPVLDAAGLPTRLLQLVLIGQPALTGLLKHADLRRLNASVTCRIELGPLAAGEIGDYVTHRLSVAGADTRIEFSDAAIAMLDRLSAGVPRVVNLVCDRALAHGQRTAAAVIDEPLVAAAAADLELAAPATGGAGLLGSLLLGALFALLVLAGAAGALWVSRDAVKRTILQWENVPLAPGGPIRRLPVPLAPLPPPSDIIE